MKKNTKTVYSTEPDWKPHCEVCGLPEEDCICNQVQTEPEQQKLKVMLDRKGRKGKTVTVVTGYKGDMKAMQKKLQQYCGSGGSVKDGHMELQGDHCQKVMSFFEKDGHRIKRSGG